MAENPPLNRLYVAGYAANDRDYPLVSMNLDPRVAGYKVPEDLSTCPDKRYPNHVFTGAQPISGDERVRHVWEILPSPWVPFTRYDDDLGPIQGRRRFVKNEGQVASLASDKRVTYEDREGSAIVYTELEETWSIKVDEDGNSLFPIRDRDFYDPSRGPVQERRQLFVPTGEEEASLENVNGIITQTSYEPYNEFLSVKIVQTYKVDGPQLIGKATNNEGQLVTVTTQRKGAKDYVAPDPTATRTVEANREDAESIVERIVDAPSVFSARLFRTTKEDLTPQKFKAAQSEVTSEVNVAGTASPQVLGVGEFARSEQQVSQFVKRASVTSRSTTTTPSLTEFVLTNEGQIGTRTLTLSSGTQTLTPSATTVDGNVEALGDGRTVKSETKVPSVFKGTTITKTKVDLTPEKFKAKQEDIITEESVAGTVATSLTLGASEFRKSEQQVTEFVKRTSTTTRDTSASTDLKEYVITPQGQLAERTLRLSASPQAIQPNAKLIDGSIEALGDGRTIKTEVRVDTTFDGKLVSAQKPDTIPERFRVKIPTIRTEEIIEADDVENPSLGNSEYLKSEKRITEFTVERTIVERDGNYESLDGSILEDSWGIAIPYNEYISDSKSTRQNTESEPLGDGKYLVREYEEGELASALNGFLISYPTTIDINLPRELKSIDVKWQEEKSLDETFNDNTGAIGTFSSLTQRDGGAITSTLTLIPRFDILLEEKSGNNLEAEVRIFFVQETTSGQILSKSGAQGFWPRLNPQSFSTTVFGKSESKTLSVDAARAFSESGYQPSYGAQTAYRISLTPVDLNIPSCLTTEKTVEISNELTNENGTITIVFEENTNANLGTFPELKIEEELSHSININESIEIPATVPDKIPVSGKYLISATVEPFKFGWFLVRSVIFDASTLA